jgi:hypothetical protein
MGPILALISKPRVSIMHNQCPLLTLVGLCHQVIKGGGWWASWVCCVAHNCRDFDGVSSTRRSCIEQIKGGAAIVISSPRRMSIRCSVQFYKHALLPNTHRSRAVHKACRVTGNYFCMKWVTSSLFNSFALCLPKKASQAKCFIFCLPKKASQQAECSHPMHPHTGSFL